jgi:hypothetical protein
VALLSAVPLADSVHIRAFPSGVRAVQANDEPPNQSATEDEDEVITGEMGRGALQTTTDIDGQRITITPPRISNPN